MQVIVDGLLTEYERSGAGKTILILPGWADTTKSWSNITASLNRRHDVIAVNFPGFGGSQQPPTAWGLEEYAAFVAAFIAKLGITNIHAIIGHSNGGAIAIRGLAASTFSADKLILLASAGIRATDSGRKQSLKLVAKVGKAVSTPLPKSLKQKMRARLYSSIGSDLLVAEHMQESFKRVVSDDVQADAACIRVPVLLVYGDTDRDTPLAYGETFHALIPGSRLIPISGAGHFLQLDSPSEIVRHIEDFLR